MTAKEKAVELLNEFRPMVNPYIGSGMLSNTHDENAILLQAKRCALVAVDNIVKVLHTIESKHLADLQFWGEVDYEIKTFKTNEK